jgi:AmmeMemoRadiSam system protein A
MAGALHGRALEPQLLSYEGPWGVGYAIARFTPKDVKRAEGERCPDVAAAVPETVAAASTSQPSLPVRLAFAVLDDWLAGNSQPDAATPRVAALLQTLDTSERQLLDELLSRRAGSFVSFHKGEDLRGCIGTIVATCDNLFDEICQNTVSAAGHDPRFSAIRTEERGSLSCSVDVLGDAEPVGDVGELDAQRFGVIVTRGFRRGLLLPSLEGVDTPSEQIAIALRKAGIEPSEPYELERFEVVRYT